MSGGDLIAATSKSKLGDALKSKYKCYGEPDFTTRTNYLTSLQVFGNPDLEEQQKEDDDDEPQSTSFRRQIIKKKITNALMLMSFREPHVLVQFWSPIHVGKRCLLTTLDQPFGLGIVDEGLYQYRSKSEQRVLVVDEEHRDELAPPGRVYCQKLPEWSLDVHSLSTRQCVQDYAACSNIHGYISLPVFEPASGSCVGVLELITSSSYVDYAYEVREVSRALKEENLKSPNVFEDTRLYVADERRQYELYEIFMALKMVCEDQKLPLAQTWALAGYSSIVATSGNLEKVCSSFNKRCIGKACMSTSGLPFYVRDLSMWGFHEACKERHLDKRQGVVGRSLSSHGLCFCGDVTNLSEDEYPLGPYARVNAVASSLAVYMKSLETDVEYVIELFLPPHSENEADLESVVKRLLKTVRQQIKNASRVQLGSMSSPQVIGGIPLHWNPESLSATEKGKSPTKSDDEQPLVENEHNDVDVPISKNQSEVAYVEHVEEDNLKFKPSHSAAAVTNKSVVPCLEVGTEILDDNAWKASKKFDNNADKPRKKRKRSEKTISREEISKHYGKTMEDAAVSLRVSRSTLKRICRSHGIPRWPYKNGPDKNDILPKQDQTVVAIHASEEAQIPLIGAFGEPLDRTDITIEHGKHSSTLVPHQQEQTGLLDHAALPDTTIREKYIDNIAVNATENVMIKATYRENTLKFSFNLSDGLVKLEELVATRFQLIVGSFSLKYVDEDGDMILIACDNDLMASLSAFKQPNIQTLIRLLVWPVVNQNPEA
uniref:protein NLP7-like isoform X2 n=1 Tax=Erigeron canadensis TaxID=72917 RepID=UPI001CB92BC2|nr:protein NLP7-like isoform X2 [Erigeron canadensis]